MPRTAVLLFYGCTMTFIVYDDIHLKFVFESGIEVRMGWKGINTEKSRQNNFVWTKAYSTKFLNVKNISPSGWMLLFIPAATFSLGVWQVRRKKWKEGLIQELKNRTSNDPIKLPESSDEIKSLEYRPVQIRGQFLHDRELYMGPRSLLIGGDASTKSSLVSKNNVDRTHGYLVITPFKLEDRDETVLINRGWVSSKQIDPRTRQTGQIEGVTNVVGLIRVNEQRPNFAMKNQKSSKLYFYRDLPDMAKTTGASEIFLDATNDFDVPGGPVGGQTRITLRNEHLSYILTWFSLSGATSYMWYRMFWK